MSDRAGPVPLPPPSPPLEINRSTRLAAQRDGLGLAQGKRTDLGPERTQVDRPTLAEAGPTP